MPLVQPNCTVNCFTRKINSKQCKPSLLNYILSAVISIFSPLTTDTLGIPGGLVTACLLNRWIRFFSISISWFGLILLHSGASLQCYRNTMHQSKNSYGSYTPNVNQQITPKYISNAQILSCNSHCSYVVLLYYMASIPPCSLKMISVIS